MEKIKWLVLFKERAYQGDNGAPESIEDHMYVLSEEYAEEIVDYLESAHVCCEFISRTYDPYDETDLIPHIIYSDGVYAWDGIIINWVKKYRVRLPDEFLYHVKQMGGEPDQSTNLNISELNVNLKEAERVYVEPI